MKNRLTTNQLMLRVILALLPGISVLTYFFGLGIIFNIIYTSTFALLLESFCLKLRQKNILAVIQDNSALLTAVLLAVCLPPNFNIIKIFIGVAFAIVIAKHLYGGIGHNIFNPAMIGFIVLLVAFPQDFTQWPNLISIADDISQATPLDPSFTSTNIAYSMPFYLINLAWMLGGLYLLFIKIVPLTLPGGFITGLLISGFLIKLRYPDFPVIEQLFLGGSMLGAFFIITDPVTAATTPRGRLIYSILAGIFCNLIRKFCGYPDGVGFAVIFMNTWVPLINSLSIPKHKLKSL